MNKTITLGIFTLLIITLLPIAAISTTAQTSIIDGERGVMLAKAFLDSKKEIRGTTGVTTIDFDKGFDDYYKVRFNFEKDRWEWGEGDTPNYKPISSPPRNDDSFRRVLAFNEYTTDFFKKFDESAQKGINRLDGGFEFLRDSGFNDVSYEYPDAKRKTFYDNHVKVKKYNERERLRNFISKNKEIQSRLKSLDLHGLKINENGEVFDKVDKKIGYLNNDGRIFVERNVQNLQKLLVQPIISQAKQIPKKVSNNVLIEPSDKENDLTELAKTIVDIKHFEIILKNKKEVAKEDYKKVRKGEKNLEQAEKVLSNANQYNRLAAKAAKTEAEKTLKEINEEHTSLLRGVMDAKNVIIDRKKSLETLLLRIKNGDSQIMSFQAAIKKNKKVLDNAKLRLKGAKNSLADLSSEPGTPGTPRYYRALNDLNKAEEELKIAEKKAEEEADKAMNNFLASQTKEVIATTVHAAPSVTSAFTPKQDEIKKKNNVLLREFSGASDAIGFLNEKVGLRESIRELEVELKKLTDEENIKSKRAEIKNKKGKLKEAEENFDEAVKRLAESNPNLRVDTFTTSGGKKGKQVTLVEVRDVSQGFVQLVSGELNSPLLDAKMFDQYLSSKIKSVGKKGTLVLKNDYKFETKTYDDNGAVVGVFNKFLRPDGTGVSRISFGDSSGEFDIQKKLKKESNNFIDTSVRIGDDTFKKSDGYSFNDNTFELKKDDTVVAEIIPTVDYVAVKDTGGEIVEGDYGGFVSLKKDLKGLDSRRGDKIFFDTLDDFTITTTTTTTTNKKKKNVDFTKGNYEIRHGDVGFGSQSRHYASQKENGNLYRYEGPVVKTGSVGLVLGALTAGLYPLLQEAFGFEGGVGEAYIPTGGISSISVTNKDGNLVGNKPIFRVVGGGGFLEGRKYVKCVNSVCENFDQYNKCLTNPDAKSCKANKGSLPEDDDLVDINGLPEDQRGEVAFAGLLDGSLRLEDVGAAFESNGLLGVVAGFQAGLNAVFSQYVPGSSLSRALFSDAWLDGWVEDVDRLFTPAYLGEEYFVSSFCRKEPNVAPGSAALLEVAPDVFQFIGHVEADKSAPIPMLCGVNPETNETNFCSVGSCRVRDQLCVKDGVVVKERLFKISYGVRAPSDESLTPFRDESGAVSYNILLEDTSGVFPAKKVFTRDIQLKNGETSRELGDGLGVSPIVKYSPNDYDLITLVFGKRPRNRRGDSVKNLQQPITLTRASAVNSLSNWEVAAAGNPNFNVHINSDW